MSNWADQPKQNLNVLIGIENLPAPIKQYMVNSLENRPSVPHVYHVTEVLYCLKKAYYRRTHPGGLIDDKGVWNIYRGKTFDKLWSPLFKTNQRSYMIERLGYNGEHIYITGTLDFIWIDENKPDEKILYDLKMPASTYYKKGSGAGKFYIQQVQTYLAMAHYWGELDDVHRCRVLMLADDLVIEEVPENDLILERIWDRTLRLDEALATGEPELLEGPEDKTWECSPKYCDTDDIYRTLNCIEKAKGVDPISSLKPL